MQILLGLLIFLVACSTSTVEPSAEFFESSSSLGGGIDVPTSSSSLGEGTDVPASSSSSGGGIDVPASSSSLGGEVEVPASSSSENSLSNIYEAVVENGIYTTRDSVAAYLCKFGVLPKNYVNKATGKILYEEETGNAFSKWNFNPWTTIGVMIGGDTFNNYADDPNPDYYHPSLPEGSYREADVDYYAENRGTKRLVYADECVIYWTADHYETFTLLEF